jgi:hypothetical protein
VARGALAQAGRPGARRAQPAAGRLEGGARCAVALSFDSDHETNELRDGGKSIGRMAWGQYGNRVGVPRIAKLLERHDVKATFYVPAVAALLYPDEQRALVAEGHEIGIHGWIHELNSVLPYEAERDLMLRAAEALEKITGVVRSACARRPGTSARIRSAIEKEMGLLYDSSLMADEDCYELLLDGEPTGVVELPVEWVRDDAVYFMMHRFQSLRPYTPPDRRASTSSAASSMRPTKKAACSSSPCIRTSSAIVRASGSSRVDPPRQVEVPLRHGERRAPEHHRYSHQPCRRQTSSKAGHREKIPLPPEPIRNTVVREKNRASILAQKQAQKEKGRACARPEFREETPRKACGRTVGFMLHCKHRTS